jgi:dihydroflavonol-4-reductase
MRALVTGASGFIGSAVARALLARGHAVRAYLEPGAGTENLDGLDVERAVGDLGDGAAVRAALVGCDALFHLAAIYALWVPDPERLYRVNVDGTRHVLARAREAGIARAVHTSSIAAVGRRADGRPASEADAFSPRDWDAGDHYVRSKHLAEEEARRAHAGGLPVVIVNPGFPFGERDRAPTPTGQFVVRALRREVPAYARAGFAVVDVDDVAEGHVRAAERGRPGERYLLVGHNVSYREFYARVCGAAGLAPPRFEVPPWVVPPMAWALERYARARQARPLVTWKSARYACGSHFFDNAKARRELGLRFTPLNETIEKSVRWFRDHGYAA